jgi:hypothetical protein
LTKYKIKRNLNETDKYYKKIIHFQKLSTYFKKNSEKKIKMENNEDIIYFGAVNVEPTQVVLVIKCRRIIHNREQTLGNENHAAAEQSNANAWHVEEFIDENRDALNNIAQAVMSGNYGILNNAVVEAMRNDQTSIDHNAAQSNHQNDLDRFICKICYSSEVDTAIIPCGHTLCYGCFDQCIGFDSNLCPFCRSNCTDFQFLYFA